MTPDPDDDPLRPASLPTAEAIAALPTDPLRVLVSGCLAGWSCTWDGRSFGDYAPAARILRHPSVEAVPFCPEDIALGTPRDIPNCVGGDGFDVLDGRARVISHGGEDWTEPLVAAARRMREVAHQHGVHLALLLDISGSCGTQVIYDGHRDDKRYQRGPGVAAAALARAGIPLVAQRDLRTLERIMARLEPGYEPDPEARDHHETSWMRATFGGA